MNINFTLDQLKLLSLNGNVVNREDHLEGHYANNPFNLDLCCKGTRQLPQLLYIF